MIRAKHVPASGKVNVVGYSRSPNQARSATLPPPRLLAEEGISVTSIDCSALHVDSGDLAVSCRISTHTAATSESLQ